MSEPLFDVSHEYDRMLGEGLKLSGEDKRFFVVGRLAELKRRLPPGWAPQRVLDFGCGTGGASAALAGIYPASQVVGVDASENALALARKERGSGRVSFETLASFSQERAFDLCYVNGVFHHIEPARRPEALGLIMKALRPGGYLALFENNPWNPGARWVMSRIPFDRDAKTFSPPRARRMLEAAGFSVAAESSLFYFPRMLSALRVFEPALSRLPLGAQYFVLARKP
ncbi:MAG: methyltransferase domain-containing protein [Elusimicrobia bacterium]|nr:methyltransferase domain-containing protein [Elusimicrobiota bacterium]